MGRCVIARKRRRQRRRLHHMYMYKYLKAKLVDFPPAFRHRFVCIAQQESKRRLRRSDPSQKEPLLGIAAADLLFSFGAVSQDASVIPASQCRSMFSLITKTERDGGIYRSGSQEGRREPPEGQGGQRMGPGQNGEALLARLSDGGGRTAQIGKDRHGNGVSQGMGWNKVRLTRGRDVVVRPLAASQAAWPL